MQAFVIVRGRDSRWSVRVVEGEVTHPKLKALGPLRDEHGCVWPPWDWTDTQSPAEMIAHIRNSYEMMPDQLANHPPGPKEMLV
jgi:hypothetical protein